LWSFGFWAENGVLLAAEEWDPFWLGGPEIAPGGSTDHIDGGR